MVELVDTSDLKSVALVACRFESGCEYQISEVDLQTYALTLCDDPSELFFG